MVYFNLLCISVCILGYIQVPPVQGLNCQCGQPADDVLATRIVGGRRATPHSYPWIVAILKNNRMHCGGSIVTTRHVLGAGHCFKWDKFRKLTVVLGADDLNSLIDVEKRYISEVIIHEEFTSTAVRDENDIAIATLSWPVKFSNKILPICLPTLGQDFSSLMGFISGWGRLSVNDSSSRVLMEAKLPIMSNELCMKSQLSPHLTTTMMCAYSQGRDGCQGDSGGPLSVYSGGKYVQAGIVSWGIGCADPKYPGVYTNVSYYVDWIKWHSADGETCDS